MRKLPLSNPSNKFSSTEVAYEEEFVPDAGFTVHVDHSRTILSTNESTDIPFTYSINPYRGCLHACAYCYARPTHEYLGLGSGTDFDRTIFIKPEAPNLLREAFEKPSWKGDFLAFSGVTDCYQAVEQKYKLTRACLEVCLEYKNPCGIITKSALVERDLDLFLALKEVTEVHLFLSIPTLDVELARKLEPYAPSPERRLKVVEYFSRHGVEVGVSLAPVIPGLTDEHMGSVLKAAKNAGAKTAFWNLLHLPGSAEEVFVSRIREIEPLRAEKILNRIRETRNGSLNDQRFHSRMRGEGSFSKMYATLFQTLKNNLKFEGFSKLSEEKKNSFKRPHLYKQGTLELKTKQLKLF